MTFCCLYPNPSIVLYSLYGDIQWFVQSYTSSVANSDFSTEISYMKISKTVFSSAKLLCLLFNSLVLNGHPLFVSVLPLLLIFHFYHTPLIDTQYATLVQHRVYVSCPPYLVYRTPFHWSICLLYRKSSSLSTSCINIHTIYAQLHKSNSSLFLLLSFHKTPLRKIMFFLFLGCILSFPSFAVSGITFNKVLQYEQVALV